MDFVQNVASVGVAAFAFVGAGWAAAKWLRRPRFICGIPPSIDERTRPDKGIARHRLGHDSVATAFRHRPHCFAQPFRRPHRPELSHRLERKLLTDRERTRSIVLDERRRALVPVLIANRGKRVGTYTASVTFYADGGKVHVVDAVTETLPVYLYADKPELVADPERLHIAPKRIVTAYDRYLMDEHMQRWGDVLVLASGRLEASLFELVVVELEIEDELDSFFAVFSVDCTDGWIGAQMFIQGCTVERAAAA